MPDDEPCGICGVAREQHRGRRHLFSPEGELRPVPPPEPESPKQAQSQRLIQNHLTALVLRLIQVLVQNGVFSGEDVLFIFGDNDDPNPGGSAAPRAKG